MMRNGIQTRLNAALLLILIGTTMLMGIGWVPMPHDSMLGDELMPVLAEGADGAVHRESEDTLLPALAVLIARTCCLCNIEVVCNADEPQTAFVLLGSMPDAVLPAPLVPHPPETPPRA